MKTVALKSQDSAHSSHPFLNGNDNPFFGPQTIQPKLKVGQPNDKYEQQADRVADAVMRMPDPTIQRQPVEEEKPIQMQEEEEELQMQPLEEEEQLQKKAGVQVSGESFATQTLSNQIQSHAGSGRSLPGPVQSEMSSKMGADFSGVNIHTGTEAIQMNRQLGAKAFTHGRDIFFNSGQYNPASPGGKHLLAHELTHVVQQSDKKTKPSGKTQVGTEQPISKVKISKKANIIQRTPLTDQERSSLVMNIAAEMNTTHADYNDGAQDAEAAIAEANQAEAEIAKTIFAMGMALIVPGFGGVVAGGFARFGVTVSATLASNIGSAIGEAAKSAGNSVIDDAFQPDSPNEFFISISNGWEEAARKERIYLSNNLNNRSMVPDANLTELHQYWVGLARNDRNTWKEWFREQWNRYQTQIAAIGQRTEGRYGTKKARWIEGTDWKGLALTGEGRLYNVGSGPRFITWISPSLKEAAIRKTERINYGRVDIVHYGNLEDSALPFFTYLDRPQFPPHRDDVVIESSSGTTRPPSRNVCPSCHGESGLRDSQLPEMRFPEPDSIFPRQDAPLTETERQELLEWIQRGSE